MTRFLGQAILLLAVTTILAASEGRRIGRLETVSWEEYFALGANHGTYIVNESYPDLSVVGALVSSSKGVGTATLIAPNIILTAAHVIKNTYSDFPTPSEWRFYMGNNLQSSSDISSWSSNEVYSVREFFVHEGWTARQTLANRKGDGDVLGVDIAIAVLDQNVMGYYPARLPGAKEEPLNKRAILSGFGSLVEGNSGSVHDLNRKRTGAENTIDRSVPKVNEDGVPDISLGGLLGIDFDSPTSSESKNALSENFDVSGRPVLEEARQILGSGTSTATALPLEASTAPGDSGGPAFVYTNDAWRVHGVVSYGTDDSTYGDVTIYTRIASHYEWIHNKLPNWHNAKFIGEGEWRESPWLGPLLPYDSNWNFLTKLGWLYVSQAVGESFWAWNYLMQDWIWMSSELFPYIYSYSSGNWIYISESKSNALSIRAYDFAQKKWNTYIGN
jgi:hypothetical protein